MLNTIFSLLNLSPAMRGAAVLIFYTLYAASVWLLLRKAGIMPWKALIPIYNIRCLYRLSWDKTAFWRFFLYAAAAIASGYVYTSGSGNSTIILLFGIPYFLTCLAALINKLKMNLRLAKAFNKGTIFGIGIFFFEIVFLLILGLGKAEYTGMSVDGNSHNG